MKFTWKFVIASLVVALAAGSVFAQNYPMPGSASAAPVLCANCEGSNSSGEANKGLPTYPFRAPITRHVGRYVDSSTTLSIQHVGFRTARAGRVRVAPDTRGSVPPRAYLAVGECVGGYTLPAFFNTVLPSALESVGSIATGERVGGNGRDPLEKIQMFDSFIYPEAKTSGWTWQLYDAQHTLGDFDFDDRGNVYAAFPPYGWGIMRDGATNAQHMTKLSQVAEDKVIPQPFRIIALHSGSRYYAIISDTGATRHLRWDVTDPTTPVLSANRSGSNYGIGAWAKYDATARLAYTGGDGLVHIWTYADFVSNGQELISFAPSAGKRFMDVTVDENGNFWAAESDYPRAGNNVLVKLTPTGATYTRQTFDVYGKKFSPQFITAGGGFVAVAGSGTIYSGGGGLDVILMKVQGGVPTKADTDDFFTKYYHNAPSGYAQPPVNGGYTNFQSGIELFKYDGKVYLFYSAFGLGDVFELEGADSVSVQMKTASFGTVNPNAKSTQAGPYPGDVVTFTAKSSNPSVTYSVDWDFGNTDSGALNFKTSNTGVDVTHQFTGLTTSSQITAAKTVTATVGSDTSISGALPVLLKVPTVRVGFPSGASAWTAVTAATAGLKAVAGQTFTDASDGSVESHFGTWTIDATDTKIKPHGTLPVGGIGAHTVKLTANYGRYDGTTFTLPQPYTTATPSIAYTVVPFLAKMNAPVKSGSNVTFSGTGIYTTDTSILSATQWTVTWTLTGTGASALATQSSTVAIGTIPSYVVPAPISPNSTITLDVSVDPTKLSVPAQAFSSVQDSQLLSTPDPKIVVTGCAHAGEPCTLTAASIAGASTADWGVTWTVKQGAATLFTSSANPYTPTFGDAGTYTVSLKVVKSVFEASPADKTLSVAAALCGPLPSVEILSISSSCNSGCDVNETVSFVATAFGYSFQDCDTITWNFGDGGTANGKSVTHKFTSAGTRTVKWTIKNTANTTGVSFSANFTIGSAPPPPPPPDTCTAPTGIGISWSGNQGCGPGTACKVGESVTFTGRRGSSSLQTCDNVAWDFGDGHTSTSRSLSRNTYDASGTYVVSLIVTNEFGQSTPATQNISVVPPTPNGNCTATPTEANIYVRYEGVTSGCRDSNSVVCQKGENINFRIGTFGYSVQSCDTIQWTFGDGSANSSSQTPVHAYNASGNSFVVSLKITNTNGTATVTDNVPFENVTNTKPMPVLTYDNFPTTGVKGKVATFKVNSDISATGWTWSFGDGSADDTSQSSSTATSRTITHTFTNTGQFSVRVTARNAEGAATDTPGSALNKIQIADAPAEPEYKYLLPIVTHIGGQNGSSWRTDVQIYSQDPTVSPSKPLTMSAVLRDMTRTLEIPSSTYIYEDFMRVFTTGNDSGPVVITTKGTYAPQIWTRTYNQTVDGTFGQFIPAIRIDDAGAGSSFGDGKYYLAGLRHDARYRTNLGFVNPNPTSVNIAVHVYDDQGVALGSFNRTVGSFEFAQFPIDAANALGKAPTRPFSVEIEVPSGQWLIAYASFIDGGSNDPVFIQAVRESELASADYRSIIVPGVGHVGDWRSDVTVFNPNGRKINVDLTYHDGTGAKRGEALNVPIGAGEFLQYDDLLHQGVFGSVADGVGILRVTVPDAVIADRFPLASARTYNDAGTGKTYGQGIGAFAMSRANVKPGKAALIPAVRDNTKYYTNIGLTNTTGNAVTVTVKLLDPSTGVELKAVPYSLGAYQSVVGQYTLDGRDNASLKIEATGNVWAFASIIDKSTKDPEYVPATPLQ